ncbi:MAG TPA: serpin family protein [Enhygromyxa sp.]|nr:serpin family protein [Enhygromyxa sp.]
MADVRLYPILLGALLTGACDGERRAVSPEFPELASELPHDRDPQIDAAEAEALARQDHELTFALYHALREGEALGRGFAISAYSIRSAFAMLLSGTVEPARSELVATMNFSLAEPRQHVALNWLAAQLESRNLPAEDQGRGEQAAVELHTANGVWVLDDFAELISREYLDVLAVHYDAGVYLAQFDTRPEVERAAINAWVAERTAELIPELFPFGSIDDMSTLVLVNAVYLKAPWVEPFLEHNTRPAPFIRLDGSQVEVAMMHAADLQAAYGEGPGYRAVALPLRGQALEVLMVVPDDFAGFEASLDASRFASLRADMSSAVIELGLPRFELDAHLELTDELQALGMIHPFVDDHSFDEIVEELGVITTVVHQTVIRVDEQGTEAAAATGVAIGVTSAVEPDVTIVVDRPFLLAIRDAPTDTLLFFGRVLEP